MTAIQKLDLKVKPIVLSDNSESDQGLLRGMKCSCLLSVII